MTEWSVASPEEFESAIFRCLARAWHFIRASRLNLGMINAEASFQTVDPQHLGSPASKLDRLTHQFLEHVVREELGSLLGPFVVGGEEAAATNRAFTAGMFRHLVHVDAIDGSSQLESLGVGWGSVLLIQSFQGLDEGGRPQFVSLAGGVVNAAGEAAIYVRTQPAVELRQTNHVIDEGPMGVTLSSRHSISITGDDEGRDLNPAIALPGFKSSQWPEFVAVRSEFPQCKVFNTAGAPVAPSVLIGGLTVAQPRSSTVWDAICAYLVGAAGGAVMLVGGEAPLSRRSALNLFDVSPLEMDANGNVVWAKPIPPFVVGTDVGVVARLSQVLAVN